MSPAMAFYQLLCVNEASIIMKMYMIKLLLISAIITLASTQEVENSKENKQDVETVATGAEENNRDKRGFIITPLSAIPAAALAPLLPYLRATLPPQVLSKVTAFLPPAQLVTGPSDLVATNPELPAILSATAPLITDRAIAAPAAPVVQATQVLPAAPPTVANPPVVTLSRLATAPVVAAQNVAPTAAFVPTTAVASPVLSRLAVSPFSSSTPIAFTNSAVVPLSRYAAQPAYPVYSPKLAPYVSQYAYASPSVAVPDAAFAAARFTAQTGLNPFTVPVNPSIYAAKFVAPTLPIAPRQVLPSAPFVSAAKVANPVVVPQSSVGVVQPLSPYANLVNYPSVQVNGAAPISSTFFGVNAGRVVVATK